MLVSVLLLAIVLDRTIFPPPGPESPSLTTPAAPSNAF
jgi:hypothetical protein